MVSLTDCSGDSWALWPGWGPGPICSPTGSEQNDPVPRGPQGQALGFLSASLEPELMFNSHNTPGHGVLEAQWAESLLLQPSFLQTTWDQKGAPKVASPEPQGREAAVLLAPPRGGVEGDHSRNVSGWVCQLRLQEEPSTCPRNAGGHRRPPPHPLALSAPAD